MKSKSLIIILIILLSITCIILGAFMILMINGNLSFKSFKFFNINRVSTELVLDEIYDNDFTNINISSDTSNIYVKHSSDEKVRVVIYGDKDNTSVDTENSVLRINSKGKKCFGICFNMDISKIEVYLPSNYDKLIEIKNNYGDIKIDEFLNSTITIDEDCGDVSVAGAKVVDIKNDYGDIEVEQVIDATINESAGDVKVGKVDNITVKNNYGDIKIKSVTNSLNIDEDCGNVEIDRVVLNKDSNIKNSFGDIKIGSTNEIYIDAKTSLGDTKIRNNYNKSDVTLKIDNSCGDIKVNN